MSGKEYVKIIELRPGMDNVSVKVRVLEVTEPYTIQTRRGPRTISEAIVGDETGRVRLTLWGHAAGTLEPGQAIVISGAWTTAYRGQVVLNAGIRSRIDRIEDDSIIGPDEVPEITPKAPRQPIRSRRGRGRRSNRSRGNFYRR